MAIKRTTPRVSRVHRKTWTLEEVKFLLKNNHLTNEEIANRLGRTIASIENKLSKMRKLNHIPKRSNAVMQAAVESVENEAFHFELDEQPTNQLDLVEEITKQENHNSNHGTTEYTISWNSGSIKIMANQITIGSNGLPTFVLD